MADDLFPGFGTIALIVFSLGLIAVLVLNVYGGSLTLISSVDKLKKVKATLGTLRIVTIVITSVISRSFGDLRSRNLRELVLQLPGSLAAAPLLLHPVDRRQPDRLLHRAEGGTTRSPRSSTQTASMAVGAGEASCRIWLALRRWSRSSTSRGDSGLGSCQRPMGGIDISLFIGLPVAALLYWILAKSVDVEAETKVAHAEAAELERLARAHQRPEEHTDNVTG